MFLSLPASNAAIRARSVTTPSVSSTRSPLSQDSAVLHHSIRPFTPVVKPPAQLLRFPDGTTDRSHARLPRRMEAARRHHPRPRRRIQERDGTLPRVRTLQPRGPQHLRPPPRRPSAPGPAGRPRGPRPPLLLAPGRVRAAPSPSLGPSSRRTRAAAGARPAPRGGHRRLGHAQGDALRLDRRRPRVASRRGRAARSHGADGRRVARPAPRRDHGDARPIARSMRAR